MADGVLALDDPVERWLPELASPRVLRDPHGELGDTVHGGRPLVVDESDRHRYATRYAPAWEDAAGVTVSDPVDGAWSRPPAFLDGAGGLVCTVDDWRRFGRMLLAGGEPLLPEPLVGPGAGRRGGRVTGR
ncbi:hypothetical protein HJ590_03770 [Naumannella sp. ID2617S]|nr:hypothetical protein [Naumannella sp. ID2617S]